MYTCVSVVVVDLVHGKAKTSPTTVKYCQNPKSCLGGQVSLKHTGGEYKANSANQTLGATWLDYHTGVSKEPTKPAEFSTVYISETNMPLNV